MYALRGWLILAAGAAFLSSIAVQCVLVLMRPCQLLNSHISRDFLGMSTGLKILSGEIP
jgi:hypothetical protein